MELKRPDYAAAIIDAYRDMVKKLPREQLETTLLMTMEKQIRVTNEIIFLRHRGGEITWSDLKKIEDIL